VPAPAAPVSAPVPAGPGPSVADMLEERLAILTRQADAHQADLHSRIRCAEAELAELEAELEDLRVMAHDRPTLFVVSSTDEDPSPTVATPDDDGPAVLAALEDEAVASEDPSPQVDAGLAAPAADEADDAPPVDPNASADEPATPTAPVHTQGAADPVVDEAPPAAGPQPLPPPSSNAEVARAFDVLGKFADQLEARYASDSEQVRSLERKISVMGVEQVRGGSAARLASNIDRRDGEEDLRALDADPDELEARKWEALLIINAVISSATPAGIDKMNVDKEARWGDQIRKEGLLSASTRSGSFAATTASRRSSRSPSRARSTTRTGTAEPACRR
jgi:hypothetical protein